MGSRRALGAMLLSRSQQLAVNQGLQRVAERSLRINRLCEARLAQLDGAHEARGPAGAP